MPFRFTASFFAALLIPNGISILRADSITNFTPIQIYQGPQEGWSGVSLGYGQQAEDFTVYTPAEITFDGSIAVSGSNDGCYGDEGLLPGCTPTITATASGAVFLTDLDTSSLVGILQIPQTSESATQVPEYAGYMSATTTASASAVFTLAPGDYGITVYADGDVTAPGTLFGSMTAEFTDTDTPAVPEPRWGVPLIAIPLLWFKWRKLNAVP